MIKRITSWLLMLIVFAGTVGINYDSHFCGGELVSSSFSVYPHDLSCGMSKMDNQNTCENHGVLLKKHCCDNERQSFQINDDYVDFQLTQWTTDIVAILPFSLMDEIAIFKVRKAYEFIGYSPPPLYEDILILNQTFLI